MNNVKNYKKGQRKKLIELFYYAGLIPACAFENYAFRAAHRTTLRKVHDLKTEGTIRLERSKKRRRAWSLVTSGTEIKTINKYIDSQLIERMLKSDVAQTASTFRNVPARESKIMRNGDIAAFMHANEINILPNSKPEMEKCGIDQCTFYNSIELKNNIAFNKTKENITLEKSVNYSHIDGLYYSPGGIYPTYRVMDDSDWVDGGEHRLLIHLENYLSKTELANIEINSALVIINNVHTFMMRQISSRRSRTASFCLQMVYDSVLMIPANTDGQNMLQLMSRENWKTTLIKDLRLPKGKTYISCDGFDAKTKTNYLAFCIPDITKLSAFAINARNENNKDKNVIACFDFQRPLIDELAGEYVTIAEIPFHDYLRHLDIEPVEEWR